MITSVPTAALPARSNTFRPERQPFHRTTTLRLDSHRVHGPVSVLNPTTARYKHVESAIREDDVPHSVPDFIQSTDSVTEPTVIARPTGFSAPQPALTYQWTSRNSRKARQTVLIDKNRILDVAAPQPTSSPRHILHTIGRMFISFPVGDVSYDVAILFTLGSAVWVLNGFFTVLPYSAPESKFPGEALYAGGITAFIGILIFLLGGYLMLLEAVNEDRTDFFGLAVEQLCEHPFDCPPSHNVEEATTRLVDRRDTLTGDIVRRATQRNASVITLTSGAPTSEEAGKTWRWLLAFTELCSHYLHDLGFLACAIMSISIVVFCIPCIVALPPIHNALDTPAKLIGAYWAPQVVGGVGFVISGAMFTIETQERWWLPAPDVLGWHVGLWSFFGGIVNALSPAKS